MDKLDGYRMARRMFIAEMEEWKCEKDRKSGEPWCICRLSEMRKFLLGLFALSNRPRAIWWLITRKGMGCGNMMRLRQTVKKRGLLLIIKHMCLVCGTRSECWMIVGE